MAIAWSRSEFSPNTYQTALTAIGAGISFVPILADGSKSPAIRWKDFQHQLPKVRDARRWFYGKKAGIALVTGAVSGGLEMLDFDDHSAYERFVQRMHDEELEVLLERIEQGYKEHSPRGVHLYYRCSLTEGNKKLAKRPLQEPPWVQSKIETRGEGGYSIAAPSGGGVHPSGLPYERIRGDLGTIVSLAPEERALLLAIARTFDEMPPSPAEEIRQTQKHALNRSTGRLPGTIFTERATWTKILEPHGWTLVRSVGGEDFWRRPGKEQGISATTNYEGSDYLYVFSTSTLFEPGVGINKFAAYTILEHQGDFSQAAKALAAQGYVEKREE